MNFVTPLIVNDLPPKSRFDFSIFEERVRRQQIKKAFMRTRLAEAQNWKCCYCGCVMTELKNKRRSVTIEHVNPISKSSDNSWENLAASCSRCNSAKGDLSYEDFMKNGICSNDKSKTRIEKKIRKYLKRAEKLSCSTLQNEQQKQEWLDTIRLSSKHKQFLIDEMAKMGV